MLDIAKKLVYNIYMKSKRDVKVRKRKDGLFELRYSLNGVQKSIYGTTAQICRDKYGAVLESHKIVKRVKSMLFGTWYDKYISIYKKGTIKQNTLNNMNGIFRNYVLPSLSKKSLKQITSENIQFIINQMSNIPRQATIMFNYLHSCLEQAKKLRYIDYNPCDACVIKKCKGNKGRALTKEEENRLIDYLEKNNPKIKNLIFLYLTTGMRRAELLAVEYADLDFENNVINVKGTKTKNSVRKIQVKKEILNLFPKKEKPFGEWNKFMVNRQFKKICDELGFNGITLHSLRHTFATRCIEQGVPLVVVQNWLGHSSYALTIDTYTHIDEEFKKEAVEMVNYDFI